MLPLLRDGQKLTLDNTLSKKIRVGDIIIYNNSSQLVAHRVVTIKSRNGQRYYIEKGDNQLTYTMLKANGVLGKVIAIDGENKALFTSRRNHIANYMFAKISYVIARLYDYTKSIRKILLGKGSLLGDHIIRRICIRSSHMSSRLLLKK